MYKTFYALLDFTEHLKDESDFIVSRVILLDSIQIKS